MESALSPREIQTRIRSGESVDDVARVAGIERDRVERFAAPVLAEREHVAGLALTSSARRRGETSSHRDAARRADRAAAQPRSRRRHRALGLLPARRRPVGGHRGLPVGETRPRQALFYFDLAGRYSVAGNDDARWVLGEQLAQPWTAARAAARRCRARTTTTPSRHWTSATSSRWSGRSRTSRSHRRLERTRHQRIRPRAKASRSSRRSPRSSSSIGLPAPPRRTQIDPDTELAEIETEPDRLEAEERAGSGLETLYEILESRTRRTRARQRASRTRRLTARRQQPTDEDAAEPPVDSSVPEAAEPTIEVARKGPPVELLVEDFGPSDASAVPELSAPLRSEAWEPAIVVELPDRAERGRRHRGAGRQRRARSARGAGRP